MIHGGIDGYCRMIVYIKCSNNNRASTVLLLLLLGLGYHHESVLILEVRITQWHVTCYSIEAKVEIVC